ncbi:MAG: DUF4291 domain-containing protein [Fuerstiella sp.]
MQRDNEWGVSLRLESYARQLARWPDSGRVILAQHDDESVVVYQAFRPEIGLFAAEHGYFGGPFSLSRMSWIKTNFLWMMYRSGWGAKPGQEVTLAVRIPKAAFDQILSIAVHSSFDPARYADEVEWRELGRRAQVRLQWDPDHDPHGRPVPRRAIQLGLRGEVLQNYAKKWILDIQDISKLVSDQAMRLYSGKELILPREEPYLVSNPAVAQHLGLES